MFVHVAVRRVPYAADKPYTYRVPPDCILEPGMRVTVPFGKGNRKQEGIVLGFAAQPDGTRQMKSILNRLDDEPVLDARLLRLAFWMRERFFCTLYEAVLTMLPSGLWHNWDELVRLAPGVTRETAFETAEGDAAMLLTMLFAAGGRVSLSDCETALGKKPDGIIKTLCDKGLCEYDAAPRRRLTDKTALRAELAVSAEEARSFDMGRPSPAQRAVLELLCDVGNASARDIYYLTGTSRRTLNALEEKGLITLYEAPVYKPPRVSAPAQPIVLNAEQQAAFERCVEALDTQQPACGLLYGVTGSGKTNVYIRLVERILEQGGSAIVLVPEIALTPQLMALFTAHFGERAALLHSALSMSERYSEWKRIRAGLASVVLGTRSAVFAPVHDLRLIVLDEEQEGTYKSSESPRYHAREAAKFRCVQYGATLLLGSATPSVESFRAAEDGHIFLCRMGERYNQKALPEVRIVNLREERKYGNPTTISQILHSEMTANLQKGEQTILLLNRRGHHKMMICPQCGQSPGCPRCSVPLAHHSANGRMMCHYCGYSSKYGSECGECGEPLIPLGAGTQRVAEEITALFPGVETLRMDTDTTGTRGAHEQLLDRFRKQCVPVLIGTQMVAKGLDFPNVTLVGVLCADAALHIDDFRASERAFSLITQVVGRAGRGERAGRAVIQTYAPDHPVILAAAAQDYDLFYQNEAALRRMQQYPPFYAMTRLTLFSQNQDNVLRAGLRVRGWIDKAGCGGLSRVLGPAPDRVARLNTRYRYHILLLHDGNAAVRRMVSGILTAFPSDRRNKGVHIFADGQP